MNWIDKLINKVIKKPVTQTFTHTFSGKCTMTEQNKIDFDNGWQFAVDFYLKNYTLVTGFKVPFPDWTNKGYWSNGFAEGIISGHSKVMDRDYPNTISYTNNCDGTHTLKYKDGRIETVYSITIHRNLN